jgi:hypothetical protein
VADGPRDVAALIAAVEPYDDTERAQQADVLAWLASTSDIYRRVKPATPPRHLVSCTVLTDPRGGSVFLVDHRLSGLRTDVSLWYLLAGYPGMPVVLDPREFAGGRWWTGAELDSADPARFDPNMSRFLAKVRGARFREAGLRGQPPA